MSRFLSKKTSRILLSVVILAAIVATTFLFEYRPSSSQNPSNGPVDDCGPYEPTDEDVQTTLTLGKGLFDSPNWERKYTAEPYKVTVIHQNKTDNMVALAETLIYTCGYGQEQLNNLFGGDHLNALFSEYNDLTIANFCEKPDDIALYELSMTLNGIEHAAYLWVKQESDTRLLTMRLVFLKSDAAKLAEFGQKIFPQYPVCP